MSVSQTLTRHSYPFLTDAGETGRLIRDFDWDQTVLGPPETWSPSLRTTLGILLHSAFPMFLFWGPELICFYNDAFLPSLGVDGKHPAIGKKGREVWPEIWDTIGPLIDGVMKTGKPIFFEDRLVPFYRNGRIEDIYWTFSYSPGYGDDGHINGVVVTCVETTEKVRTINHLQRSENRFRNLVRATAVGIVLLIGKEMKVEIVNEAYARLVNRAVGDLAGKPLFSIIPDVEAVFRPLLLKVLHSGEPQYLYDHPYNLDTGNGIKSGFLNIIYQPYREENGEITGVLALCHDITEQTKAIREKDRLIAIVEASHEFIGLAGTDTKVQYMSPAALRMVGWDDYEGKSIADCVYPEDQPLAERLLNGLVTEGRFSHEIRLVNCLTGEPFWLQWNAFIIRDSETGEVTGLATVSPEITQRKQTEADLEASEQKLRSLFESAPFPIGVYEGREMRIRFANQSIIHVWGKGADVIDRLYSEVLPELENQAIFTQLDEVFTTGVPFHAKYQRVDIQVDGRLQPFYFNYSFMPLRDSSGNVYGVMNTAAEVTDLVLAKQKVEETEAALRGAVELAELVTWSLDIDKQTISYSKRFMDWLGFSEETKVLDDAYDPLPESHRLQIADSIAAAIRPGSSGIYENEHPIINRLTGQVRIIHAQAQVFYDSAGKPKTLTGTARDITAQRKRQEELERQVAERTTELAATAEQLEHYNEQLTRSNEELAQYAYVASHDLQEPLRKIRTFAGMLSDGPEAAVSNKLLISKISSSSERMANLIQGLLEFSRLVNATTATQAVDLNRIVASVINDFELAISEKGAEIHLGELPAIEGVTLQLNQLFYNLIGNAIKFSKPDQSPVIEIHAETIGPEELSEYIPIPLPETTYYRISIADNGIGFEKQYADQIFEIFKRLHTRDVYPGSGIGLALCRRIVTNHKGHMVAISTPGAGSTFQLILPERQ